MKIKVGEFLGLMLTTVSFCIALNAFYSYIWLTASLQFYGLTHLPIITIEDLLYRFGNTTVLIFTTTLIWLLLPLYIYTLRTLNIFNFDIKKTVEVAGSGLKKGWKWFNFFNRSLKMTCLILLFFGASFLIWYFTGSLDQLFEANNISIWFTTFCLGLIIISLLRQELIIICYISFTLIFGLLLFSKIINDAKANAESTNFKITERLVFEYQNKRYGDKANEFLVFYGFKKIILGTRKSSKKIDNHYLSFSTDEVSNIEYYQLK